MFPLWNVWERFRPWPEARVSLAFPPTKRLLFLDSTKVRKELDYGHAGEKEQAACRPK
jgi:hypothetical protein